MQIRIASVLLALCTFSLPILAMDSAALSIQTSYEENEMSDKDAQKAIESIYPHAQNENERDQIEEAYEAVGGNAKQLESRAQQAAQPQKAPEGVSAEFEKITQAVASTKDNQQAYALEALRFLFGEADPDNALYKDVKIDEPQQASQQQVGAQLKDKAGMNTVICP